MRCPCCESDTPDGGKFCIECGSPLRPHCPRCGAENVTQAKFCTECGTPLIRQAASPLPSLRRYPPRHVAEKILSTRSALEGERKQVTVLFADLKGSLELLADRDPEDARQLLDPVLERMMEAVRRYEGTVNQVLGDGIMALFGAPIAHEDHAVRACYAALAMQETVGRHAEELRQRQGLDVQIRVGLNSGEVVVRAIGSDLHLDYTAVGQTTHLAARMEQCARPGAILLTDETWRLVEGYFEVKSMGAAPVKGLTTPVQIYELLRAEGARSRLQVAATRGLTPFVGRKTELAALHQALERAAGGHGQVVALVGEPGVGRSRLVYEFIHAQPPSGWLILESCAASYGHGMAYLPVLDLLKTYFQLGDRDDPRQVREKLTSRLLALDATLLPMLPALLALLDLSPEDPQWQALDPTQRRQRTLDAVKRLLLRESQRQPLLLVVEDLHWIDTGTQTILDTLVESLPASRTLLLVSYRPEYEHSWGRRSYYTQQRVDPLPPEDASTLLQALFGDNFSLAPLKQRLIERTEGNPLFLEESVRTLVETQALVGERGAYRVMHARRRSSVHESPELVGERAAYHLMRATESIRVPATVQAVLAARIDRLPAEEKRLLQMAAIIGTEVPFSLLHAIAGRSEGELRRSLGHLQAAEFLYEASLFPEVVYKFRHALTHEVVYGSLLRERRRSLHASIAEVFERVYPGRLSEHVERLAHHTWRGEVWDKAVTYCRQAGARADDRAAFREAVTYFEQALEALGHLPETADTRGLALEIHIDLGDALIPLGEHGRSRALLGEAEALARHLDDRSPLARVLVKMAIARRLQGDLEGAVRAGQRALDLAAELGDRGLQTAAAHRLGQAYYGRGDFGQAAELLRQAVTAVEPDMPSLMAYYGIVSRSWLALTLSALGAFAAGRCHGEEALRLALLGSQGDAPVIAHGCLGLLYVTKGDMEPAIRVLGEGLARCHATGNRDWSGTIAVALGYAYAHSGRCDAGLMLMEEAIKQSFQTEAWFAQAVRVVQLSEVYLLVGRHDEAAQYARQALDLARQQQARGNEALALYQLGAVHAHADPPDGDEAEARYRDALALAEALSFRPLQAHCLRGLGTVYAKRCRWEQARLAHTAAVELYRAMDMTFWLPQAEAALEDVGRR